MNITAAMVKELRERTGAGMMECKKALEAAGGDIELAIETMRKSGQAKAAKRAGKIAAEGIIIIKTDELQKRAVMLEVNCETDFVSRGEHFKDFAEKVAQQALQQDVENIEKLLALTMPDSAISIEQARQELIAKIGENVNLRRMILLEAPGMVGSYLHGNRIGVLVALDQPLAELGRDLAMHIAASNPLAIDEKDVSATIIDKEREIYTAQAQETGKPADVIEKMVAGRINKFLKETCLLTQPFIKDPEKIVASLLSAHNAKVLNFARYEVGEGIEKQVQDLASEVQAQLQGTRE